MGRGQLTFKGDTSKKKKKKKSKHQREEQASVAPVAASSTEETKQSLSAAAPRNIAPQQSIAPSIQPGTGTITTSGTVMTGHGTRFEREMAGGDAILATIDGKQEMRVVQMRLSNTSCGLSSAFSKSLMHHTAFSIIRKPKSNGGAELARKREESEKEKEEIESAAFGAYRGTNDLVYRERTEHGSYRFQKVALDGADRTRTELLALRAKKSSDKYC